LSTSPEAADASEGESSSLDLTAAVLDSEQLAEGRADVFEAEPPGQPASLEVELDLAENLTAFTLTAAAAPVTEEGFTSPTGPGMTVPVVGGAWTGRIWMEQIDEKRFLLRNVRPGVELLFREHFPPSSAPPRSPPVLDFAASNPAD
jgi:hypothetical protein